MNKTAPKKTNLAVHKGKSLQYFDQLASASSNVRDIMKQPQQLQGSQIIQNNVVEKTNSDFFKQSSFRSPTDSDCFTPEEKRKTIKTDNTSFTKEKNIVKKNAGNLMIDARVIRKNAHSNPIKTFSKVKPNNNLSNELVNKYQDVLSKHELLQRQLSTKQKKSQRVMKSKDEEGRHHLEEHASIQTEGQWEELLGNPETHIQTIQTEDYGGKDIQIPNHQNACETAEAFTQMESTDPIFDFELEVQPIVRDFIHHKVLKFALEELTQEEELKILEYRRLTFEKRKQKLTEEIETLKIDCNNLTLSVKE